MPTLAPSDKVLVTGANGYVGVWVVKLLLERGYQVRGAVRTKEKGEALVKIIKDKVSAYAENFEFVIVADLTAVCRSLSSLLDFPFDDCASSSFSRTTRMTTQLKVLPGLCTSRRLSHPRRGTRIL